jgi:ribonuclease E
MTGISRKLPDTERSRLKSILKRVLPENAGVIVRTASEGASEDELSRDVARLAAQWDDIDAKRGTANAPALLYGEPDLTVRVIRDIFNEDFSKLIVSGAAAWDTVNDYIGHVAPDLHDRVEKWTSDKDVWSELRIDEQLAKALDRKVWLPSGGSLVIDRTEAMTVIDINTGKFTGQGGNLEQTVTENNLEAAEEIVRQLRLRDIGGIIVIDFIDMVLESNRDLVLRRLVECLGRDRTKHQVAEVTSLGLVQMTRKRVGEGLFEVFSSTCDSCNGRGVHVHMEPVEGKRGTGKSAGDSRGDGRSDTSKQRGKGKGKGKSDDVAPTTSAAPDDSAADDRGTADGEGGRKRRRGRRGGTDSAGAAQDEAASPEVTSTVATSSDTVDEAPSGTEGADTPGDATSAVPAAAGPVETPEAPVFAPRGIDLTPEPASTPGPKRRRRGASRPAGAPTTD